MNAACVPRSVSPLGLPDINKPMNRPARKRFGQHFLHDAAIIERILDSFAPQPAEQIIEIGPGRGALTLPLLKRCKRLTAVELDRDLISSLEQQCKATGELTLIEADALKLDFNSIVDPARPARLIGNLPYNISTPLIFHLLEQSHLFSDMLFMLQKEVVTRLTARPGSKAYGRLSVAVALRSETQALFDVPPTSFTPPPKVQSAMVRLQPRKTNSTGIDWQLMNTVLTQAFSARRKTLSNALKGVLTADQIMTADVDPRVRAEQLEPAAFVRLATILAQSPTVQNNGL